jgi:hypothetical protein
MWWNVVYTFMRGLSKRAGKNIGRFRSERKVLLSARFESAKADSTLSCGHVGVWVAYIEKR